MTSDPLKRFEEIRNDPWLFLHAVRTRDEADPKKPIKPFPVDKEYLKLYTRLWQKERRLLVPKSRRMIITWATIALHLWETMFFIGRSYAFVSKKEEDSADLIDKAKFILENLDEDWVPKELRPKHTHTFNKLIFPEIDSKITGYPQGADQLRSFTFSGIFFDEMAFMEEAENAYAAALPTLDAQNGGGRMTGVSSAAPSFFKRMVFDQIENGNEDSVMIG